MTAPEGPTGSEPAPQQIDDLFDAVDFAKGIDTEEFKLFLDHLPIAIVISKLIGEDQRILFANKAYEELTGSRLADCRGRGWSILDQFTLEDEPHSTFSQALLQGEDYLGTFRREQPKFLLVEAYAGLVENEDGTENYRIVALVDVTERERAQREELSQQLRDKDMLLREIQHRVRNNLQLIIALIRLDARNQNKSDKAKLDRLAGRIESLRFLYQDISADGLGRTIDLGHYLTEIATAVMHTYGVDGLRLDIKVDHAPVSINVAMPVGLLVNELLTNSLKYAFTGRANGTLTLRCLHEKESVYQIVVADDGVGLPEGATWPLKGKLGALILQSLQENVKTDFQVETAPGRGMRAAIEFVHTPPLSKPN